MNFSIIKAEKTDISDIFNIIENCAMWLSNKKLNHWSKGYNIKKVEERVNKNTTYLLKIDQDLVGTITLIIEVPFYFRCRKDLNAKWISIVWLAVHPKYMWNWYATKLLEYAEKKAKDENIKYLRLDASFFDNKLTKFYQNRWYKVVGTKRITDTYKCNFFERCL